MSDSADPRPAGTRDDDREALAEHRLSGEQVYSGALLDVRRDRVRLPDGGEAIREYVVHPGAVLIVPIEDDGRFIVERQFRYPQNRAFLEFPAGKRDPGERSLETARRELIEEAGFAAVEWTRLGVIHPVISYSTEAIEIYAARGLSHVGARLDHGEFLELLHRTAEELYEAIDDARLTDAKTIAALVMHSRWISAPQRSCRVRIAGTVQGVGYRDWLTRAAQKAGVAGWVRNRRDGSVEAHFQARREPCDRLIEACRRGPPAAQVALIEVAHREFDASLDGFGQQASA